MAGFLPSLSLLLKLLYVLLETVPLGLAIFKLQMAPADDAPQLRAVEVNGIHRPRQLSPRALPLSGSDSEELSEVFRHQLPLQAASRPAAPRVRRWRRPCRSQVRVRPARHHEYKRGTFSAQQQAQ